MLCFHQIVSYPKFPFSATTKPYSNVSLVVHSKPRRPMTCLVSLYTPALLKANGLRHLGTVTWRVHRYRVDIDKRLTPLKTHAMIMESCVKTRQRRMQVEHA